MVPTAATGVAGAKSSAAWSRRTFDACLERCAVCGCAWCRVRVNLDHLTRVDRLGVLQGLEAELDGPRAAKYPPLRLGVARSGGAKVAAAIRPRPRGHTQATRTLHSFTRPSSKPRRWPILADCGVVLVRLISFDPSIRMARAPFQADRYPCPVGSEPF